MELIIKPTSKCNFNCKFCAASNMQIPTLVTLPIELKTTIDVLHPSTIIFTGGEPTCCPPRFYREVLEYTKNSNCHISLTSNLMNFIKAKDAWSDLLKNERFGVCTSFQNDGTRIYNRDKVLTKAVFKEWMLEFKSIAGYAPTFISVIFDDDMSNVMSLIELAIELKTKCKLNPAIVNGRQQFGFPRYKMLRIYLDLIKLGLDKYEENTSDRHLGRCPFSIFHNCNDTIRAVFQDERGNIWYSYCEDLMNNGDYFYAKCAKDLFIGFDRDFIKCVEEPPITNNCYTCELFRLCNNCTINKRAAKRDPNYCKEMKKLIPELKSTGWKI